MRAVPASLETAPGRHLNVWADSELYLDPRADSTGLELSKPTVQAGLTYLDPLQRAAGLALANARMEMT